MATGAEMAAIRTKVFRFIRTSAALLEQMRRILLKAGIFCSAWERPTAKHQPSVVNGLTVTAQAALNALSIYGDNAAAFAALVGERYTARSHRRYAHFSADGKYACYPVVRSDIAEVCDTIVYNTEVEEDHFVPRRRYRCA